MPATYPRIFTVGTMKPFILLLQCLLFSLFWTLISCEIPSRPTPSSTKLVIGVDGGTESIRACCFDAHTGRVVGKACAVPYVTRHPHPGWAEQNPNEWYDNLVQAVRGAVQSVEGSESDHHDILAICVDTTCCSVVALDKNGDPLRPCILWMDQRAAKQTQEILEKCQGDPALDVNCGGEGPISAEWMTPKALWIHQNEPEIWEKATTICEYQDYINLRLTGEICASSCNAASRWHWNGEVCIKNDGSSKDGHPGRPMSLYQHLGIPELADKLPRRCLPMGSVVGRLSEQAAKDLGLSPGLTVVQGGPDAFVGMIGLGCIYPGQLCLITGSSHLHCVVSSLPTTAPGTWGAYRGAPLPGINFAEGGQSSTGSIIRWAKKLFGDEMSYKVLDDEAEKIAPGADGLVALETFQGSRTPVTDPLARGALMGLTLSHTRGHVWRALMEAVCFGTRACIEGLAKAGHGCDEIVIAGGATRSTLWLQMHADVTGKPVVVCENSDAPLLGCAILASVGCGVHATVDDAVKSMVRTATRVEPERDTSIRYDIIYKDVYTRVADAARPVAHAIQRQKLAASFIEDKAVELPRGGETTSNDNQEGQRPTTIISPSLLASDWSIIKEEVARCLDAGGNRLHVDVFDGVFLDSPKALTFGPQMVDAIRRSCQSNAVLDLHMCVERPMRYIVPMAQAGGDRFIFQFEATQGAEDAMELAVEVVSSGMSCGVSINPSTNVDEIFPLLQTNLIDLVDVLAVEPGFGGQIFQRRVLEKIKRLVELRKELKLDFEILVDGGINPDTVADAVAAGADILVSGSFLFQHQGGMRAGIEELLGKSAPSYDEIERTTP